jgi:gamma-glutamyltranspeptidase/glutathione hydrolase
MFDPRPGNSRSLEPHRRRVTSMTPTMVFAGNRMRMLLGAPGGSHIPFGIPQVILLIMECRFPTPWLRRGSPRPET